MPRKQKKRNIYHPCQAENESPSGSFSLIHFDIISLQQAPSLPVLLASDTPLLSQYWSSSQTSWQDTHRRSSFIKLNYWSTSTKSAGKVKLLDVTCLDDQKGFEKLQLQKALGEKEQIGCKIMFGIVDVTST